MAGIAVISLLEKLSRLRMHHAHLISGIHKELELLERDLLILKEFLVEHHDEEEEEKDRAVREVKREIKKCVYEAEDSIDAYLTQMAAPKIKNFLTGFLIRRRINFRSKLLLRVIGKPQGLSAKGFPGGYGAIVTALPQIRIDNIVGRDDEEEAIISYLMESREELGVISIEGMNGIGKTTLARGIYVNTKIAYEFPVRIWICVSYNFKLDDVLRNILRAFTSQDIHSLSHGELLENVYACMQKKKFLLVLDDMLDCYFWRTILNVLPKSNGMGKVLITISTVGSILEYVNFNIRLHFLDAEESWKLLQLRLFGNLERCPFEFEAVGRNLARKCDGLPLNIILAGGILNGQLMKSRIPDPIHGVLKVYESVNWDLSKGMNPFNAMELAYSILSDELRQCFLYMGVFPKDYEISAWTLTRLWIAEGFVRPREATDSLEEAATQNLGDLIRMSLVMVDKVNPFGKVKTCRVHNIIGSFILRKAVDRGLFHLLSLVPYPIICRRLCVHSNVNTNLLSRVLESSGVRSFLYFNESTTGLDLNYLSPMLDVFHLLKVLDSKSIKFHKLPQQITKLFHLRYVTLFIDILNTLPEPLSELWNLETLVVDTKSRVITMEANIWRLIWLRHLKTNAAIVLSSNNEDQSLAGGENLQTLTRLSPESCTTDVSERARNLKSVGIRGDLEILFGKMFLERFDLLEKLKLIHDVFPKMSSENPLHQLPPPNRFPPNLKWLTLSQTHLLWDRDMPILANIKTLKVLKLKDDAFTGVIWRGRTGDCFPRLEFFLIENTDLVLWKASTKSLPRLSCLVLKNCENLREIPEAVAENLESLEIERLGKSAVDSARRIANRKQQAQEKKKIDRPFKLYIGPGCYR